MRLYNCVAVMSTEMPRNTSERNNELPLLSFTVSTKHGNLFNYRNQLSATLKFCR